MFEWDHWTLAIAIRGLMALCVGRAGRVRCASIPSERKYTPFCWRKNLSRHEDEAVRIRYLDVTRPGSIWEGNVWLS